MRRFRSHLVNWLVVYMVELEFCNGKGSYLKSVIVGKLGKIYAREGIGMEWAYRKQFEKNKMSLKAEIVS